MPLDYESLMQQATKQHSGASVPPKKRPESPQYASTKRNLHDDTKAQTHGGSSSSGNAPNTNDDGSKRRDKNVPVEGQVLPTQETLNEREKHADEIIEKNKTSDLSPSDQIRTESAKRRSARKPKTSVPPTTQTVSGIPRKLMDAVRRQFDSDSITSNSDALCAFIMIHLDVSCDDVSENVLKIVKEKRKEDPYLSVETRLKYLDEKTNKIVRAIPELEMAIAYYLFDRLGFRLNDANDARNIDMLESNKQGSVTDIVARMREQGEQMRKQDNIENGRPIK